jgi:FtsP/CotA-like multicopper oxidase with cupredoxin domain
MENDRSTPSEPRRREFLGLTLSASAALLAGTPADAEAQASCPSSAPCEAVTGKELANPGELVRGADGFLRGIVTVEQELRSVTFYQSPNFTCRSHLLRAYHGYTDLNALSQSRPVTLKGVASPGPTLRARVGDTVQLTFLNRIDPSCFPDTPLSGAGGGCDVSRVNGAARYPGRANPAFDPSKPESPTNQKLLFTDTFPNCFRVSNTTNLHFHGTHTTPSGFGDNVLVGVLPNRALAPADAARACQQMFASLRPGDTDPLLWKQMSHNQQRWTQFQSWYGGVSQQLAKLQPAAVETNQANLTAGEWPQYWPGFYPYYFTLPKYTGGKTFPAAGQTPGTHWYHAHQHGSTSIQLLNGMAGAFIITSDDYDGKIKSLGMSRSGIIAKPIQEKVMVMQLFAELTNLQTGGTPQSLCVNGQLQPQVSMKPGEVQWWRLVNGSIQSHGISTFFFMEKSKFEALAKAGAPPATPPLDRGVVPGCRLIARDGVQFAWANYVRHADSPSFRLSPGNRVDALVKAPQQPGDYVLMFWPASGATPPNGGPPPPKDVRNQVILTVRVGGTLAGENTHWYDPTLPAPPANYPVFPEYLADIKPEECAITRRVVFSMSRGPNQQPVFMIDGKQFNDGTINKVMLQGDTEEWLLVNTSPNSVMHPFHIHVNPFQIVEVFDPSYMEEPQRPGPNYVWQDTIAIPAGFYKPVVANPDPTNLANYRFVPGHVRIRHRFLDFPGKFVLHCHILGHEDRGMMQLIEVVPNSTIIKHH